MKVLVYTVSDFKTNALDCIRLLLSSFNKINFDFKIITNNFNYKEYEDIIYDEYQCDYVGFLKYSKYIPSGYDRYVYLDSDILYFGDIEDLFSNKNYSCVIEDLPMSNEWFLYKNHNLEYLDKIKSLNGFNAGTFSFTDINFLKKIRDSFEPYVINNTHYDARLEQSSFNFIISQEINFDLDKIHNLTHITQLFSNIGSQKEDKKLYHFCGFSNEMQSKFYKMKNFYDQYKRRN
jgi:hypothetical protein